MVGPWTTCVTSSSIMKVLISALARSTTHASGGDEVALRIESEADSEERPGASGALEGLRVLELGQLLAGPFAGHLLADLGAEVIKVEQPGAGDPMREWGHDRYRGRALWWPSLARNKKCVSLNLRTAEGQRILKGLAACADVLLENFRPGSLEKWGLGPDVLHAVNPRLIIVRVSGYGQTGPYADRVGFASAGEALGGLRHLNGYPDQPPPRTGISLGDSLAGMFAVHGVLAALYWRDVRGGGRGQVVDASILESCFALLESAVTEYDKLGTVRGPSGTGLRNVSPSNIFRSRDGKWVVIAANTDTLFARLCQAIGQPDLATDPRFATHAARGGNAGECDAVVATWAAAHDAAHIDEWLNAHGVVSSSIYDIADISNDAHYRAREMILHVDDPDLGEIAVPGFVPKLSETPSVHKWTGPAEVGHHNREVYGEMLGLGESELEALARDGVI
jgi:crotonobetainyl-CoA:carnitine CoA-transferase CaiB-like acyl-CoA transferase